MQLLAARRDSPVLFYSSFAPSNFTFRDKKMKEKEDLSFIHYLGYGLVGFQFISIQRGHLRPRGCGQFNISCGRKLAPGWEYTGRIALSRCWERPCWWKPPLKYL